MRDIPRGKGYDKASMTKHKSSLETLGLTANAYARMQKLNPDFFVRSWMKHFPFVALKFDTNQCEYCKRYFAYSVKTQRFCDRKCASDQKRDKEYFGGNRKKTVGLAERICQICGTSPARGIASHHVYGKLKDPKGETLVALCKGCHDLVTKLGGRVFVSDPKIWEKLITFAHLRKHGPDKNLKVKVKIENST